MSKPDLPRPRKRPSQSRSLMLVKAIQEACLKILLEEGPGELTTQRIADVAGVNIASLYQYFPNKEAILAEVFEEQINHYTVFFRERILDIHRLSLTDFEATLEAIVDVEIEQRLMLHRMAPEFYLTHRHHFDVHQRIEELTLSLDNPGWDEWFPNFLDHHRDRLRDTDARELGRMATHMLSGTLLSVLENEPELLGQDAFRRELLAMLSLYLCK